MEITLVFRDRLDLVLRDCFELVLYRPDRDLDLTFRDLLLDLTLCCLPEFVILGLDRDFGDRRDLSLVFLNLLGDLRLVPTDLARSK